MFTYTFLSFAANMLLFLFLALMLTLISVLSFNTLPYPWLCDYSDDGTERTLRKNFVFKSKKSIFSASLLFAFFLCAIIGSRNVLVHCGNTFSFLLYCLMIFLLSHILLSDLTYCIIPDQHLLAILFLGFIQALSGNSNLSLPSFFYGLLTGFLPFFIILLIGLLLTSTETVGFGDVKLLTVLGGFFGTFYVLHIFLFSMLTAGLFSIALLIFSALSHAFCGRKRTVSTLPLAPFITLVSIFCF